MTNVRNQKLLRQFGYHLRELRLERDWSQERLANQADIPINQVGRIERGEVNATLSTLHSIANALKVSLPELVEF